MAAGAEGRTMCRRLEEPAGRTREDALGGLRSFKRASFTPPADLPVDDYPLEEHRRAQEWRPSGQCRIIAIMPKYAITVTRAEHFPEWYQAVVRDADMAEVSPVRGCMIIKPWGYGIWELLQRQLDDRIKAFGFNNSE